MGKPKATETPANLKIRDTLIRLLETKTANELEVQDIVAECGLNRNSFYYHYNDIADLLEQVTCSMVDNLLQNISLTYDNVDSRFIAVITEIANNRNVILNIYHSISLESFEKHLWRVCNYIVESFVDSLHRERVELSSSELAAVKDFFRFELFGFIIDWISNSLRNDAVERARILAELLKRGAPIFDKAIC